MTRSKKLAFMLLLLGMEFFLLLYHPVGHYPDELSHLQCAAFYRDERRLPDPYRDRFRLADGREVKIQQEKHPPYTYFLAGVILRETESWFGESSGKIGLPGQFELSINPGKLEPNLKIRAGQVLVLRLFMVGHWCLAAWFLLRLMQLLWPHRPRFAWSLALMLSVIPMAALGGASFTPDTPLSAFSTVAFYYIVRAVVSEAPSRPVGLRTGLFLAFALLSKMAAIYLLPVLFVAAFQRARSRRDRREGAWFLFWALLPAVVLAGWWYVYNLVRYGDPFQMLAQIETSTHWVRREPLTSAFYEAFPEQLFRTFFGFYDTNVLLHRPVYYLLAGVLGVAVVGLLLLLRRGVRAEVSAVELRALPASLVGCATLLALVFVGNLTGFAPQGRYLFPALGAIGILLGVGLEVGLRVRGDSRGWYVAAVLWYLFALWSFHTVVLPRKAVRKARAQGEGKVLFYEDCGSPALHPHRVQGNSLPDTGQLGRSTPWRSLDGHAQAVVYRFPLRRPRDLQVRVLYFNPDPRTPYLAGEEGRFVYPSQRLFANGHMLHDEIEITSSPKEFLFPVPAGWLSGGELVLRFEKVKGEAAMVSEIWIEEPWLVRSSTEIRNRSSRELPFVLLWREGESVRHLEGLIEPQGVRPSEAPVGSRAVLLPGRLAPWSLKEAEGRQVASIRWFGDQSASGGVMVRGEGVLARLGFAARSATGLLLARVKERGGSWSWRRLKASTELADGVLEYRTSAGSTESLDYVLVYGTWGPPK